MVVRSLGTVECVDAGEAHIAARSVGFVGRAMSAASAGCVVRRCSWLTTLKLNLNVVQSIICHFAARWRTRIAMTLARRGAQVAIRRSHHVSWQGGEGDDNIRRTGERLRPIGITRGRDANRDGG